MFQPEIVPESQITPTRPGALKRGVKSREHKAEMAQIQEMLGKPGQYPPLPKDLTFGQSTTPSPAPSPSAPTNANSLTSEQIMADPLLWHQIMVRSAPHTFAEWASAGKWKAYPHLAYLGREIAMEMAIATAKGTGARIVINMGPRFGKSEFISKWVPIWFLENNPQKQVVICSYGADLADKFGRQVRDEFATNPNLTIKLRDDVKSVSAWMTKQGGGMRAAGLNTGITGHGYHCFPSSVILQTEQGPMSIAKVARLRPKVLSWNHQTGKPEYRRVIAARTKKTTRLVTIKTAGGRTLPSTPDHRHYSLEHGYTEAGNLQPGQHLFACTGQSHTLLELRKAQSRDERACVLQMLPEAEARIGCHETVRDVLEEFSNPGMRAEKKEAAGRDSLLLFGQMQGDRVSQALPEKVSVRGTCPQTEVQVLPDVLAEGTQRDTQEETEANHLPVVWENNHSALIQNPLLFDDVQECPPLRKHDRGGQLTLQNRHQLRETVPGNAAVDLGSGRGGVRGLRPMQGNHEGPEKGPKASYQDEFMYSSHGRNPESQRAQQPDHTLHLLSQKTPQSSGCGAPDAISLVEETGCDEQSVYDIQVEGNHNFFANEILTHNCGLIDDPVKDWQASISPLEQKAFRDWFDSTFYTRKEPGAHIIILMHRWNANDPAGYLIKEHTDPWRVIRIPAIAEENDVLGRKVGEGLCEDRVTLRDLIAAKNANEVVFQSMYQQNPPEEDGDRVYDHFIEADNTDKSIRPYTHDSSGNHAPLRLTMDFNVNPGMHAEILQYDSRTDMTHVYQEIHGWRLKTEGVMDEFEKWVEEQGGWKWEALYVHGDRSGKTETTQTSTTDYQLIQNKIDLMNKKHGWNIVCKLRVPNANPPIKNRVDTVNEALRDASGVHVKVHPVNCPRLLADLGFQLKDEDGLPDKSKKEMGHACFVAGTQILTEAGMVPIEKVQIGDRVMTRQGFKPVINAAMTNTAAQIYALKFSNGVVLRATADHPIWSRSRNCFVPLDKLCNDEVTYGINDLLGDLRCRKPSFTEELCFLDTLMRPGSLSENISVAGSVVERSGSIDIFGSASGERSLTGITSTTRTTIRQIIESKTWNAFWGLITSVTTRTKKKISIALLNCCPLHRRLPRNGMGPMLAWGGIGNMQRNKDLEYPTPSRNFSAGTVERLFAEKYLEMIRFFSVVKTARQQPAGRPVSITKTENAYSAEKHSQSIDIAKPCFVDVTVVDYIKEESLKPVYNLTVSESHEYFANGILVSNCDALGYCMVWVRPVRRMTFAPQRVHT